jgi:uncharacterized protein YggU (UPF0235/DUF167 family)
MIAMNGSPAISLEVVAKPGSSRPRVARRGTALVVAVRERAVDGRANDAILRALATWLDVPRQAVAIAHGAGGRRKFVTVAGIDDAPLQAHITALAEE